MTGAQPPNPPLPNPQPPSPIPHRLRRLAVIVTKGTSNHLFQAATLVRAATTLDTVVEVLFRDQALLKLQRQRVNVAEWSPAYAAVLPQLEERLRSADFTDMETFLRDAKEHGDHVSFWACSETVSTHRITLEDLVPLLDGERSTEAFLASARGADALMTF